MLVFWIINKKFQIHILVSHNVKSSKADNNSMLIVIMSTYQVLGAQKG